MNMNSSESPPPASLAPATWLDNDDDDATELPSATDVDATRTVLRATVTGAATGAAAGDPMCSVFKYR